MRPYWKGYLKLALVSCPIALHAASSTAERIAFRQINKTTGNRLRQQLIDEETREPVAPEHKGRGYEVARGQYLIIEDEELEAIEIESTPERAGRAGGLCGHSRGHARQGHGGARAAGALQARAGHCTAAV
jgi:Ku protein